MTEPISLPVELVAVVLAFPALYVLNGYTPWSSGLWAQADRSSYVPFWCSVATLHWLGLGLAVAILATNDVGLRAVGLHTRGSAIPVASATVAALAVGGYLFFVLRADPISDDVIEMPRHGAMPANTRQRVCYFGTALVTAPICEELLYRGVAILALEGLGLPLAAAMPIASLSFVFVHGMAPVRKPALFVVYFVLGLGFSVTFVLTGSLLVGIALHAALNAFQMTQTTRTLANDDRTRPSAADAQPADG